MIKLRNKKTGEIAEFMVHKRIEDSEDGNPVYSPFIINPEEWEDVPEPKGYFYIRDGGNIDYMPREGSIAERHKAIGNYFGSEEEAKRAVGKLKALQRLKDKGFRFCCDIEYESLCGNGFNIPLNAIMPPEAYTDAEVGKDLDLLLCTEEKND